MVHDVHEHKVFSNFFGEFFFAQIPGLQDVSIFFGGELNIEIVGYRIPQNFRGKQKCNFWETGKEPEIWADFEAYSIICPPK